MQRFLLSALSLIAVGSLGCGGPQAPAPVPVSGKIMMEGKPLADATVGFSAIEKGLPARYRYAQGKTDAEGKFTIAEVRPSEYMVTVNRTAADPNKAEAVPETGPLQKYSADSPLRAKVEAGKTNNFEFDLK